MTFGRLLFCIAVIAAGIAVGALVARYVARPASVALALLLPAAPTLIYLAWGMTIGCTLWSGSNGEDCYGWGFGMILMGMFIQLPWVLGLPVGYMLHPFGMKPLDRDT
tara:strand:- start:170 stop:493 length:324 start_codon:yes stop_codon:yes gene_type:complete